MEVKVLALTRLKPAEVAVSVECAAKDVLRDPPVSVDTVPTVQVSVETYIVEDTLVLMFVSVDTFKFCTLPATLVRVEANKVDILALLFVNVVTKSEFIFEVKLVKVDANKEVMLPVGAATLVKFADALVSDDAERLLMIAFWLVMVEQKRLEDMLPVFEM